MSQGDPLTPTPGWNRLLTVDNGRSGTLSFGYAHVWQSGATPNNTDSSADTLVATPDGETPIGDIHVGDQVRAYDATAGNTGSYTVTAVLVHRDPVLVHLIIGNEQIETTPEHPFFVLLRGWVTAGDLQVGYNVWRANGTYSAVKGVVLEHHPQVMYNLTVAQAHTFFVGKQQFLVHNTCGPISMDEAIDKAVDHAGSNGIMEKTGRGTNFQFRTTTTNASGETISRIGRLDVNPADPHVIRNGSHLNLQVQINGQTDSNPHIPIDPSTIRPGDYP